MEGENSPSNSIVLSCYYQRSREGEQFVPEHVFSYQLAGSLLLHDGTKEYQSEAGTLRFTRRNQLLKFIKQPPAGGAFKSLSVWLDQPALQAFSLEYGITAEHKEYDQPFWLLPMTPLVQIYFESLSAYTDTGQFADSQLISLKQKECILLLLQSYPDLKNVLFDFTEPQRLELEAFMNKNFQFNVPLERFAYLTGRSLATFKRDFLKVFGLTPGRWLQRRRLQEAHYLLAEKGKAISDIYLDLGFEDLSHFSYAFKKQFGYAPKTLHKGAH
jgi:AraC-like DNA-binding protein